MKSVYKFLFLILLFVAGFCNKEMHTMAAMDTENVSVTVPTTLNVVFGEDGNNQVSELYFHNNSLVPIEIQDITVTQYNGWELVPYDYEILADSKQLCLRLDDMTLLAGSNAISLPIDYGTEHIFDVDVKRGAWSQDAVSEQALRMEFQYKIGTRQFTLYLDGNGGMDDTQIVAENGTIIDLPSPERAGYVFAGWQDENGTLYNGMITMPIGDLMLTAQWNKANAYATYCETDKSLNFYLSVEPIEANTVYRGKLVAAVYTGFENAHYGWGETPWHSIRTKVERVEFHDVIQPIDMAHWFLEFYDANYADMRKLDTSRVTSMEYMCNKFGVYAEQLEMIGLENWDVSNVKNMFFTFCYVGRNATGDVIIGDLSRWNVSNVTTMCRAFGDIGTCTPNLTFSGMEHWNTEKVENMGSMFRNTGKTDSKWSLDLSGWNVNNVTSHNYFNENVESKIIPPIWVN